MFKRIEAAKQTLGDHLGRRGGVLLTLGLVWISIGLAVISNPTPRSIVHIHEMLPVPLRVLFWVAPGVLAVATASRGRGTSDWLAFSLLMIGPLLRAASYLISWIQSWNFVPPPLDGDTRGWIYGSLYVCLSVLIRIIAGWEDRPVGRRTEGAQR